MAATWKRLVFSTELHDALTLGDAAIQAVLDLSTQALTLDSQAANTALRGPVSGAAADPTFRADVEADLAAHNILTKHAYTGGAALDVFGLSAANTIAKLTPSSNPGAAAAILKTDASGYLQLAGLGIGVAAGAANRITMVDGGTIGQAAGPLLTFDDTDNQLSLTGAKMRIGTATHNTKMTDGLTLDQGTADDEILTLKSSDVDHGMTTFTEVDSFATFRKAAATTGGLQVSGFSEATEALVLFGAGVIDDSAKTTSARAYIELYSAKKSGTSITTPGANANLVAIGEGANGLMRFLFDVEGSAHADVEWVPFDEHDDVALLGALETEFARRRDPIRDGFGEWMGEHARALQSERVVNFYDDGPRAMVNFTRLSMLLVGAVRQQGARLALLEEQLLETG